MKSRLIMIFISIILILVIVSIIRSIYSLWQKEHLVIEQEQLKEKLVQEQKQLQAKLKYVENPEFIEQQARNKLNLQKEGEAVVVLPKNLTKAKVDIPPQAVPVWQQWLKLFF